MLGIAIAVLFLTGLLSHYQYEPWQWLPLPARPVWGYRLTQGIHVATGIATIPLLLIKLWSIYPNLFRFPPIRSIRHALERISIAILVSSALVQVATGFLNVLNWYGFGWFFPPVHRFLGYVVVGSVLLHIGVKLPDIVYGLRARVSEADVLTEIPWSENPESHSNAGTLPDPPTPGISRRGLLTAAGARHRFGGDDHRWPNGHPTRPSRPARPTPVEPRSAAGAGQPYGRAGPGQSGRVGH